MNDEQKGKAKKLAVIMGVLSGLFIGISLPYQSFFNINIFQGQAVLLVLFGLIMPMINTYLTLKISKGNIHPLWDFLNDNFDFYMYMFSSSLFAAIVGMFTLFLKNGSLVGYEVFLFFLAAGIGFLLAERTEHKLRAES